MTLYKSFLAASPLVFSVLAASQASAAVCTATVTQLSVEDSSTIFLSTSGQAQLTHNSICKLNGTTGAVRPIDPKACEKMHSHLLAALLSGRTVELAFTGDACPTFAAWASSYMSTTDQLYFVGIR